MFGCFETVKSSLIHVSRKNKKITQIECYFGIYVPYGARMGSIMARVCVYGAVLLDVCHQEAKLCSHYTHIRKSITKINKTVLFWESYAVLGRYGVV